MARTLVLVHAPLVGRSTWGWVASELADRTEAVLVVPDLHRHVRQRSPQGFADALADVIRGREEITLVGHSGSGPLLPLAAAMAGLDDVTYVFVDAAVPPTEGPMATGEPFREWLEQLAGADRILPPWHAWWGPDGMAQLVPDENRRRVVMAEMPRLPLSYFDIDIDIPTGWQRSLGGFVLLSETYRRWADDALSYGWPVAEVLGTHLELVNQPAEVAAAILRVSGSRG